MGHKAQATFFYSLWPSFPAGVEKGPRNGTFQQAADKVPSFAWVWLRSKPQDLKVGARGQDEKLPLGQGYCYST